MKGLLRRRAPCVGFQAKRTGLMAWEVLQSSEGSIS